MDGFEAESSSLRGARDGEIRERWKNQDDSLGCEAAAPSIDSKWIKLRIWVSKTLWEVLIFYFFMNLKIPLGVFNVSWFFFIETACSWGWNLGKMTTNVITNERSQQTNACCLSYLKTSVKFWVLQKGPGKLRRLWLGYASKLHSNPPDEMISSFHITKSVSIM